MKLVNVKIAFAAALLTHLSAFVQQLNTPRGSHRSGDSFKILALLLCFLGVGCQPQEMRGTYVPTSDIAQIVEGKVVTSEEERAPFLVGFVDEDNNPYCTGILLKKNIVLTAAHCVFMQENYSVYFGVNHKQSKKITVEQVEYMEPFMKPTVTVQGKETALWDLAMLKLSEEAPAGYTESTLIGSASLLKSGLSMTPMGYGLNQSKYRKVPCKGSKSKKAQECFELVESGAGVLREGHVEFDKKENDLEFSTKPQGAGSACNGDSGGPIFVKQRQSWAVAGILSRGRHEEGCQHGNIYTDLTAGPVKAWIKESLSKLNKLGVEMPH